ncbi:MAG: thioredoxin domain-containing protein [Rhodothermales bacterium]
MPNHLENELSPYLLQHRLNPVDWYPWGEEAFQKARDEDKPIFLSIGYATCHWCHVMEHESFEDKEVAALMNETFVAVKVDREERPDIDQVYMTYCQMSTGQGGWPLTIIMTPEKQPFFSATYLPKRSRFGRIGMMDLVPRVDQLWKTQKEDVLKSAEQNVQALNSAGQWEVTPEGPAPGVLDFAYQQLEDSFDPVFGGFSEAPKFPSPHQLQFLVRYAHRTGSEKALNMAGYTLKHMRFGGIFDHVGFGFHRYATDQEWLVPHFEKMLYDQAMIALAAVDLYQATKDAVFKEIAEKIFSYVLRDMTDEAGGFYSAEDADSEGVEGKFYVWSVEEIGVHLGEKEADLFNSAYNLLEAGNFKEESTGELTGDNIPYLTAQLQEVGERLSETFAGADDATNDDASNDDTSNDDASSSSVLERLESARQILFDQREKRIHPEKDDKVLTDWNGLMIAAFSRAAGVFNESKYVTVAREAAGFIESHLTQENGRLLHRFRQGSAGIQANLDDYAFMVQGLLDLYEASFDIKHLQRAIQLNQLMITYFWDEEKGGLFFSPDDGEVLISRQKEAYDGAIPSGNSIALLNLLKIGRITGKPEYEEYADKLMCAFAQPVNRHPSGFSAMLAGLDFALGTSLEIVVVGDLKSKETRDLLKEIQQTFLPNRVVLQKDTSNESALADIAPYSAGMQAPIGGSAVYICENYQCNQPVNDIAALRALLGSDNESNA